MHLQALFIFSQRPKQLTDKARTETFGLTLMGLDIGA